MRSNATTPYPLLRFRPIEETARATLDWEASRPTEHAWRAGITRQRERELLDLWKQQP